MLLLIVPLLVAAVQVKARVPRFMPVWQLVIVFPLMSGVRGVPLTPTLWFPSTKNPVEISVAPFPLMQLLVRLKPRKESVSR